MAAALDPSNSEINNVFERLCSAGPFDVSKIAVHSNAIYEFLVDGLKAAFPPEIGQTREINVAREMAEKLLE